MGMWAEWTGSGEWLGSFLGSLIGHLVRGGYLVSVRPYAVPPCMYFITGDSPTFLPACNPH